MIEFLGSLMTREIPEPNPPLSPEEEAAAAKLTPEDFGIIPVRPPNSANSEFKGPILKRLTSSLIGAKYYAF
jgi:hypothetical protein